MDTTATDYINVIFDFDLEGVFVSRHTRWSPPPQEQSMEYYAKNAAKALAESKGCERHLAKTPITNEKYMLDGWEKYAADRILGGETHVICRLRREVYIPTPPEMYKDAQLYFDVTQLEPILENGKLNVYFRGYSQGVGYPWAIDAPSGNTPRHKSFSCYNKIIYSEDLPRWVIDEVGIPQ